MSVRTLRACSNLPRKGADTVPGKTRTLIQCCVVYNPTPKPTAFNALWEDEAGAICVCGTNEGLFRLDVNPNGAAKFQFIELSDSTGQARPNVSAVLKDRRGALWASIGAVLYRLLPDGRISNIHRKTDYHMD